LLFGRKGSEVTSKKRNSVACRALLSVTVLLFAYETAFLKIQTHEAVWGMLRHRKPLASKADSRLWRPYNFKRIFHKPFLTAGLASNLVIDKQHGVTSLDRVRHIYKPVKIASKLQPVNTKSIKNIATNRKNNGIFTE
jgi:hypothetical protein